MTKQISFKPFGFHEVPSMNGGDFLAIIQKAARYDETVKLNKDLSKRVEELESILAEQTLKSEEAFAVPLFPQGFEYFGNAGELTDGEIQDGLVSAAQVELEAGKFHFIGAGDSAIIRMHDEDRIITVVAQGYYEHQEILHDRNTNANGCDDPDCICQFFKFAPSI
ncbi:MULTISPECIES: hypothetical protein [Paenibacillus]|uniref:Uncharacterized protein n=1 Tax=Paenibacillus pabuli TaxID=1472 RepID=A0A855YER9_9BACL|nr:MULTISPECIES: hypothetical protein [Paenibacillus]PWW43786.1 hypothetical protein DET56_10212 [Paenibacillus pabuli]PXW09815.1 hypothetical protein DEU73_10212 [Paenibacillus taichungensis]